MDINTRIGILFLTLFFFIGLMVYFAAFNKSTLKKKIEIKNPDFQRSFFKNKNKN